MKTGLGCAVVGIACLMMYGCGGHEASSREIVPKIESYKAGLATMAECASQIEGARELVGETVSIYKSRAFKKYVESAAKEIMRAESACDKYERYKKEASESPETLEKMKNKVVDSLKSALTVVENGISQQEAYKVVEH